MGIRDFLDHVVYGNLETNDPDLRISERTDNLSHICECGVYVFKCVSVFVCVCVCVSGIKTVPMIPRSTELASEQKLLPPSSLRFHDFSHVEHPLSLKAVISQITGLMTRDWHVSPSFGLCYSIARPPLSLYLAHSSLTLIL